VPLERGERKPFCTTKEPLYTLPQQVSLSGDIIGITYSREFLFSDSNLLLTLSLGNKQMGDKATSNVTLNRWLDRSIYKIFIL